MKKKLLFLLLTILCLFSSGCWDMTEPERLGLVMAVGVGLDQHDNIRITCAAVNVRSVAGGGMGGGGGGNEPPFHVHSGSGKTVFDAVHRLSMEAAYELFFAHTKVIIISEELARTKGIRPIIDFFERNEEIRRGTWLLIAKQGQLDKIINSDLPIKTSKGQFLERIIEYRHRNSFFAPNRLGDFIEIITEKGNEPYTAGVALRKLYPIENPASFGEPQQPRTVDMLVLDTAVFKNDKMIGWLDDQESRGLLWVKGQVHGGILTPELDGKKISLGILESQTKVEPTINEDGNLQVNIKVKVASNIGDSQANLDFSDSQVIKKIQELQAEEVKKEINSAITKAQELETDIMGFGRSFHARYPNQWKQVEEQWYDIFPTLGGC